MMNKLFILVSEKLLVSEFKGYVCPEGILRAKKGDQ